MDSIRIKRGPKALLPRELPLGELAFCTDTRELYVGMGEDTKPRLVTNTEITEHLAEWKDKYQEVSDQFQTKYEGLEEEYATRLTEVSSQLEHIIQKEKYITPEEFSAVGDGKTDDYNALQDCINKSIELGVYVLLKNKYYTSRTLDISNVKGILGIGHSVVDKWDSREYNGEVIGYKWFMNHTIPYSVFADGCNGSVILSDVANPIVRYEQGTRAKFEDFAICGSFKNVGQVGFADVDNATSYNGSTFTTNNFKIVHCGGHGMVLKRGMEYFQWQNTNISNNGGYGVLIDRSFNKNPCEYSNFNSCVFENNMLDGFHLKGMRRGIIFNTCNFSRNGQYQLPSSTYRDRTCPSSHDMLKGGVRVTSIGDYSANCLELRNCFAEETQNMLMLEITSTINNIVVENCQIQCLQRNDEELKFPSALVVTQGNYIGSLYIKNNVIRKDTTYSVYNSNIRYGVDWTIEGYGDRTNELPSEFLTKSFKEINIEKSEIGEIKYSNNFWELSTGTTTETTITTLIPKETLNTYGNSTNHAYKFAFFYIGYNHSATNGQGNVGDIFGITKGNKGQYELVKLTNNIDSLTVNGTSGEVSFTCPAWKCVTLQRIEMGKF